jgi:hypothetical protein
MQTSVVLTVAESKRLIARGIVKAEVVRRALAEGTVAVASGTTNGYVVEALTGERFDKTQFVTGHTLPAKYQGPRVAYKAADLVLRKGERLQVSAKEAVAEMGPGDVFMKGANALNYERGQAGVLIGHPTGGTVGAVLGTIVARRIRLLHPVGLEKSVPGDLHEAARLLADAEGKGATLWVTPGQIFTEVEALAVLAGVRAVPVSAGGIGGAEGAIWLALIGDKAGLDAAQAAIASVQGEPPFLAPGQA